MWLLLLLHIFPTLSTSSHQAQHHRQQRSEIIAQSLTQARNTTPVALGPQVYQAPLYCEPADLVISGVFMITLAPSHSLTQHQRSIGRDIMGLLGDSGNNVYSETIFSVKGIDEELLQAVRSDREVVLVECEIRHVQRWYNLDGEEVFPNERSEIEKASRGLGVAFWDLVTANGGDLYAWMF